MALKEFLADQSKLERYSFLWSEVRLVVAAAALFLGGIPPLVFVLGSPAIFGLVGLLLTLAWIVSGAASAYLLYRWFKGGKTLFGGKTQLDVAAFFVSAVSGLNLGLAGLLGRNIGLSISANRFVLLVIGLLYLWAAWHLYKRWKQSGQKLF